MAAIKRKTLASKVKALSDKTAPPHLIVESRAGTGKTTTLVEGLKRIKGFSTGIEPSEQQARVWDAMALSTDAKTVCFVAFNKSIATELQSRVPEGCEAMTMHSMGFRAVNKAFKRLNVSEYRVNDLIAAELGIDGKELRKERPTLLAAVKKLVSLVKMNLADPDDPAALNEIVERHDIELGNERAEVYELVPKIIERCRDPQSDGRIDYDDMVWLPVALNLPLTRYDLLLVDECLPGWTPVMLADGQSVTIKEIVDSPDEYCVRAYDTATGTAKNCRVIGRQKILNQKPLVKIKAKHYHRTGTNRKSNFVVCTVDHKIWTINRGWVPAGEVRVGDDVIIETAARTTQKGKVTAKGRETLAHLQLGNRRGEGNAGGNPETFNRVKGGNGRGMTLAESTLLHALNSAYPEGTWRFSVTVNTGDAPQFGRGDKPSHYKLDIANVEEKIVVEIDGHSHRGRKGQDHKKETFLRKQGWEVIRVTNREAIQKTAEVVDRVFSVSCPDGVNCPRPARVTSVDPVTIPDNFVYDITVEDCHNFYANGILVHNCQDLNRCQQALAKMAGRRLVLVGDPAQSIYGFAGADSESMSRMYNELKASAQGCDVLPLTVTRRCGKRIVEEARRYVPNFSAHESNPDGVVREVQYPLQKIAGMTIDIGDEKSYVSQAREGDFALCRTNAPLVNQCFRFLKRGMKATIQGRDIGQGLISLIKKLDAKGIPDFIEKLQAWLSRETNKEHAKKFPSEAKLQLLDDKHDCLLVFAENCDSVDAMVRKIEEIFTDDKQRPGVRFSSIHKAKGLEAKRVFYLTPAAFPGWQGEKQAWEEEQEKNLRYVAITRAIEELIYVK